MLALNDLTLLERDLNKFFISTEEWDIIKELHHVLEVSPFCFFLFKNYDKMLIKNMIEILEVLQSH